MESFNEVKEKVVSKVSELSSQPAAEGSITKKVEGVTAQVPSLGWMGIAFTSMAISIAVARYSEKKWLANFVGQWVPNFLLIGIYNKVVKLHGSDQDSQATLH